MAKDKQSVLFNPPIKMDLGNNPGKVVFESPSAFQEWLATDIDFWLKLDSYLQPNLLKNFPGLWEIRLAIKTAIARRNAIKLPDGKAIGAMIDHVEINNILQAYAEGKVIHCDTGVAAHMLDLAERGLRTELAYLYIAAGPDGLEITSSSDGSVIDLVQLLRASSLLETNRGSQGKEFTARLEGFFEQWQTKYNGLLADHLKTVQAANKLNDLWDRKGEFEQKLEALGDDMERRVSEVLAPHHAQIETAVKDTRSEITKAQSAFDAASAAMTENFNRQLVDLQNKNSEHLEGFVQSAKDRLNFEVVEDFWDKKRKRHLGAWIGFGVLFIGGIAAAIAILVFFGFDYLILIGIFDAFHEPIITEFNVPIALFATLPIIGAFWVLRQFLKLFLVNLAQHSDASERVAMMETFRALQSEGKLLDQDRILIMQALFRPGPGSGDSDGGTPASWFDILLKRLEPPKG